MDVGYFGLVERYNRLSEDHTRAKQRYLSGHVWSISILIIRDLTGNKPSADTYSRGFQLGHTIDQADEVKVQLMAAREAITSAACWARIIRVELLIIAIFSLFVTVLLLEEVDKAPGEGNCWDMIPRMYASEERCFWCSLEKNALSILFLFEGLSIEQTWS